MCNCRRWIFPKRGKGKGNPGIPTAASINVQKVKLWTEDRCWAPHNPKSINPQASCDTGGGCPSWITLTSPAATTDSSVIAHVSFVCTWMSTHLPRTLSDSSQSSPSGSPLRWWWCSRCPSSSGGHERRKTECASAPPGWFSACRTAGRQRWEGVSFLLQCLAFSWCHVTALHICQHYAYNNLLHTCASATHSLYTQHTYLMERDRQH